MIIRGGIYGIIGEPYWGKGWLFFGGCLKEECSEKWEGFRYENTFTAKIERFECVNGWHYVTVPEELITLLKLQNYTNPFGYIAITAKTGDSSWNTSIMPMGDKTNMHEIRHGNKNE